MITNTLNRLFVLGVITAAMALSQPTIAPTESQVGPRRGEDVDGYNIVNSVRTRIPVARCQRE